MSHSYLIFILSVIICVMVGIGKLWSFLTLLAKYGHDLD